MNNCQREIQNSKGRIRSREKDRSMRDKQYQSARKDEYRKYRNNWQEQNRFKRNVHCKVFRAVDAGKLHRPGACSQCGKNCKPEAHHEDYSRPLDVTWLCRQCHREMHRKPDFVA